MGSNGQLGLESVVVPSNSLRNSDCGTRSTGRDETIDDPKAKQRHEDYAEPAKVFRLTRIDAAVDVSVSGNISIHDAIPAVINGRL